MSGQAEWSNRLIKDTFVVWPHGRKSVSMSTATWITPEHQVHGGGEEGQASTPQADHPVYHKLTYLNATYPYTLITIQKLLVGC